ncbi:MAG: cytochrome C, partial [Desulfuromonas sp.]
LGLDLSDDHPIGFDYTTVAAADGGTDAEIDSKANVEGTAGMTGALSYGGGDDMWCSSCHDVHGISGVSTFLRIANTNSDLCLTCHIK